MNEIPKQATRADLARGAREHYEKLSSACTDWLSTIPHAIDVWEKEPELHAEIAELTQRLDVMTKERDEARRWARKFYGKFYELLDSYYQKVREKKCAINQARRWMEIAAKWYDRYQEVRGGLRITLDQEAVDILGSMKE